VEIAGEILFFSLLIVLISKIYAIVKREDLEKSFLVDSLSELAYISLGLLGNKGISVSLLHLEYQFVFRILAFLMLYEFFRFRNEKKLSNLKGIGFSKWGFIFGFSIFGSLGISLITSKQLILNTLASNGLFTLGYLVVIINIIQAIYLISIFETIIFKKGTEKLEKVSLHLPIFLFTLAGISVFAYPDVYLILPKYFANIKAFHLNFKCICSGIRTIFVITFSFVFILVFLYSLEYIKTNRIFYYIFLFLLGGALFFTVISVSFESFYLFWEIMTISSYLLIMHHRDENAIKAGKIYFIMCISGAYLLQLAFSFFYANGIEGFSEVSILPFSIALLLLLGFGIKAGIVPFHRWLPLAHPAAPSSISAPLSGILTKAGIFGIIVITYLLGFRSETFSYIVITIGLITLFYGETMTLYEKDIKRLLAYSTIGQIGEIISIIGIMSITALAGALYHIINHAIIKDLLFLSAGILIMSANGNKKLEELKGIGKQFPFMAFPLGVGIFAITGFPPFGNFNSKFLMIYASIKENNYLVAFGLVIGALIGLIGILRVFRYIFLLEPTQDFKKIGGIKLFVVYILALISFLLGIFPNEVMEAIKWAIAETMKNNIEIPRLVLNLHPSILVMLFGALVVYLFGKDSKTAGILSAMFSFVAMVIVLKRNFDFGVFFATLVLFMAILNFIYAGRYMDHSHKPNRFFANFIIMIVGILGVALLRDIYSIFFFWEIMGGWALYIALVHEEDSYSIREATKYLIYNFAGAGILAIGFSIILKYGSNIGVFSSLPFAREVLLAIFLLSVGFLAKAAQVPIRIDYQMHPKPAPTPISGYISSVMLKTGPFMLVSVFYLTMFGSEIKSILYSGIDKIGYFSAIVGVITIIMGIAFGLITTSMKRLLIYLTVAEIGYIIVGISLLTKDGLAGGILHLVNHMFFKDLLFLCAGAIFYKTGIDDLNKLSGIGKRMPITFGVFMIAIFSTAGVPMFSGFISKWIIYHALMTKGYVFLALFCILGSVMILLVFVRFMYRAYFGDVKNELKDIKEVDWFMSIPMIILAILSIIIGIFPYFMLYPINKVLVLYGMEPISLSYSSIIEGKDILNTFTLSACLLMAFIIGYMLYSYSTNRRKTNIFLSGVRDLGNEELHLKATDFYENLVELILKIILVIKKIFGFKGGYIER